MMKSLLSQLTLTGAIFAATAPFVSAQTYTGIQDAIPVAIALDGATKYDGWYNLTVNSKTKVVNGVSHTFAANTGYPTVFQSANAWPTPILSQLQSDSGSRAALNKVANGNGSGGLNKFNADGTRNATAWGGTGSGPYPAGDGLYAISFSNVYNTRGGTIGVFEANPLANLQTMVYQVEIGSANGYDFWEPGVASGGSIGGASNRPIGLLSDFASWAPVINLTFADAAPVSIVADYAALITQGFNGTIPMPTGPGGSNVDEPIWVNLYGFQWDLSGYTDIVSFNITSSIVEHSQFYSAQLDQGGVFNGEVLTSAIPEPASYAAFAGLGMLALAALRRRRA